MSKRTTHQTIYYTSSKYEPFNRNDTNTLKTIRRPKRYPSKKPNELVWTANYFIPSITSDVTIYNTIKETSRYARLKANEYLNDHLESILTIMNIFNRVNINIAIECRPLLIYPDIIKYYFIGHAPLNLYYLKLGEAVNIKALTAKLVLLLYTFEKETKTKVCRLVLQKIILYLVTIVKLDTRLYTKITKLRQIYNSMLKK